MNPKEVSQSWEQNIRFVLQHFRNYLAEPNPNSETRIVDYVKFLEQIYKICDERTEYALAEQARGIKEKCEEIIFTNDEEGKNEADKALTDLADYITNTYLK